MPRTLHQRASLLCIACAAVVFHRSASCVSGEVVFHTFERVVTARASPWLPGSTGQVVDSRSTSLAGSWSELARAEVIGGFSGDLDEAEAFQQSVVGPNSVSLSGFVYGEDRIGSAGSGEGVATSTLRVEFDVLKPAAWWLQWSFNATGFGNASFASFRVSDRTSGAGVYWSDFPFPSTAQGTLLPGSYSASFYFAAGHSGPSRGSSRITYAGAFVIPGPSAASSLLLLGFTTLLRRRSRTLTR